MANQTTGICDHWVLVYKDGCIYNAAKNEQEATSCNYSYGLECFDTEEEMKARIIELGLVPMPAIDEAQGD